MKERKALWGAAICLAAFILAGAFWAVDPVRKSLRWAQRLKLSQVERIELLVLPSGEQERYRLLDRSACAAAVSLINNSRGRYVSRPESLCGGSACLYITLKDGSVHRVSNIGNAYLVIDGDTYSAGYRWLASWERLEPELWTGNSQAPEDFDWGKT